ncbi:hypothetical protein PROP_01346 [Propionicimonas sp. T2.31MG-18]|uniref:hypothetical protein n=1 Tax=Propionicimonas sp. T2.31MG-18 TaxID=3157620 RepID=UPI0035E841DA
MSHHNDDHGTGDAPAQGPVPGPFLGSSASEEEGVRAASGSGNAREGEPAAADSAATNQPGAVPVRPDPLDHDLGEPRRV